MASVGRKTVKRKALPRFAQDRQRFLTDLKRARLFGFSGLCIDTCRGIWLMQTQYMIDMLDRFFLGRGYSFAEAYAVANINSQISKDEFISTLINTIREIDNLRRESLRHFYELESSNRLDSETYKKKYDESFAKVELLISPLLPKQFNNLNNVSSSAVAAIKDSCDSGLSAKQS